MGSNASAFQATDTSGFVTLTTDQTISGEKTFSAKASFTAPSTTNSAVAIGSIEIQPFSINNAWIGENVYYDSGFLRRANGAAGLFYFQGQEGAFRFAVSGAAGSNTGLDSGNNSQLKVHADGTVAIGGLINILPGNYSGATLVTTALGTTLATGGTGGTQIAKLRTEKAVMAAGTTGSIADTPVAASSIILVTPEFAPAGRLYYTISAGVGFTILSTDAGDAGSVSWQRITL